MAFNPNLGCDLFISYARVDDEPVFGVKWVSTLLQDLRNLLAQKMGRHDAFSIWWDEINLRGNHAVTPGDLHRSAAVCHHAAGAVAGLPGVPMVQAGKGSVLRGVGRPTPGPGLCGRKASAGQ